MEISKRKLQSWNIVLLILCYNMIRKNIVISPIERVKRHQTEKKEEET